MEFAYVTRECFGSAWVIGFLSEWFDGVEACHPHCESGNDHKGQGAIPSAAGGEPGDDRKDCEPHET